MKALWFLPFTFAAGAEGFALFAPYLVAVLATVHLLQTLRRARQALREMSLVAAPVLAEPRPAL